MFHWPFYLRAEEFLCSVSMVYEYTTVQAPILWSCFLLHGYQTACWFTVCLTTGSVLLDPCKCEGMFYKALESYLHIKVNKSKFLSWQESPSCITCATSDCLVHVMISKDKKDVALWCSFYLILTLTDDTSVIFQTLKKIETNQWEKTEWMLFIWIRFNFPSFALRSVYAYL